MTRAEQLQDIKEILLSELNYRVECGEMSKDNSLFEMLEGNTISSPQRFISPFVWLWL